ncbi:MULTISPECIES: ATP-binding protein [unclassified Streptomyces]|uniref:ATP-binding protein n=1 Tax=unclassified Streptomyces TaxID=2593676 RepID=UPI00226D8DB7|nr:MULTISPECIES: ATP-binding protein [unclassified Streptomyces]MCY0919489.1 ATP-binding protein [Streptomyces sp. H27-G5]MCY0959190.1 ATP-binding protein [Streptomyces sp. H27-H5]
MDDSSTPWRNTTHDWARSVDPEHLALIRRDPAGFAPGGLRHLILEVLAYAADEAESRGAGRCTVTLRPDGSVSVADNGRGTDTRFDEQGRPVRKPVMATKDLRFFDHPDAESLPDGHPRRGMSVVAALSEWLVHINRRAGGAWSQRYEHGVPATGLTPIADDGTTGTVVHFRPAGATATTDAAGTTDAACDLVVEQPAGFAAAWPFLSVAFDDRRAD